MRSFFRFTFFSTLVFSLFLLSGCKDQAQQVQQAPEAAYIVIQTEQVAVINELSGRLESFRNSDVRARVAGVLEKRLFEEGADVKQGEKLFIIDPRSYEASVQNARAALARAEANFMQADLKYKRYIPLVEISAVSKQEYDDALAAQKQAAADVASAKASLINAKLDLEYATVLAPISGRIGRSIVTEGALVGQGEVTLLAVIQQIDPIYLNLTQSSAELLQLQQAMRKGVLKGASEDGLKVTLIMEDGTPYLHPGKLLFSDITVDPSTGEISIRALFPNPDGILLPGMYVRGQLEQAINENAITVPKQAVQRSTEGSTVFVINKDNVAEIRRVQTGASYQEKWVVLDGLNVGDKVIVEGVQKVRPGSPVSPVVWTKEVKPAPATDTTAEAEKAATQPDNAETAKTAPPDQATASPAGAPKE
ncbi:efflux RND transporter periplasmic adaptor subunit [Oxalobacter vibrioformis]|uniref:Efflux RND transporter periplasmic adaptor subunit n=1 Tax=Oxalobacter vibrioformis TaxID=933080 RepID=A0A9E9LVG4_9BURK|nr:efflux RND transporter periplasmic adaptor subunit [Oxalobacter vibrioformis]WAW09467.1 efflux RND transporter periplasmic adaptor subunit [Oxalobacter vibrioformis]